MGAWPAWATPISPSELLVLRDTAQTHRFNTYLAELHDSRTQNAQPLTLAQVQQPPWADQFVLDNVRQSGKAPGVYRWLRGYVRSETAASTHWMLLVQADAAAEFDVYAVRQNGQVQHYRLNSVLPMAQTHAVPHRHYNLRLNLPLGETVTLYLRGPGDESLFVGVAEQAYLLQQARLGDQVMGPYFGILLALLAYNFLLFISVRDRSYLLYSLYVACFILLQFDMTGYMRQFWGEGLSGYAMDLRQNLLLSLCIFFGTLTARAFLETPRLLPRFDKLLRLTLAVAWVPTLVAVVPMGSTVALLGPVCAALWTSVVLLVAGILVLLTGYGPARYYMLGWTLLLLAIANFYLGLLGITPRNNFWAFHGVHVASALEMILLSLGLADRINLAKKERQQAQEEALAALRDKEKAQTQTLAALHETQLAQNQALATAREKDEVQQNANRALAERANELQQAYHELQESIRTSHKLQELDELKTRFFTNISHELRTPLTLIISPLEQLLSESRHEPGAAPRPEYALMHRNARRLLQLINQLLDIARLESGQMRLAAAPVDLARLVGTSVAAFESLAASRDVALSFEAESELPDVYLDADQFDKILYNLLGNALKFTPAGGQVTVSVGLAHEHAVLRVRDTGVGIPAEHLPLIFDRFHQVDSNLTRLHDGTGIGLALVKELVTLHHGAVRVMSTVGQGTTFVVELPLGAAHLTPAELADAPLEAQAPQVPELRGSKLLALTEADSEPTGEDARPLVLVVEDNPEMRDYLRTCLATDFRVLTADDGEQGLQRIVAAVPDLVVSDLMMPRLDGLELCRRLRADERTSHIPVILLTARSEQETRLAGFGLGADEYLTKPFRPDELRVRIHNLIRQRQLLRQRFGRELKLELSEVSVTSTDEAFLSRAMNVVEQHLADADFSVEAFAEHMAMSRVQLHRKLKALTDQSTSEFVRTLRLRRAAVLLQGQAGNVAEVADQVGFANLSYFAKCFRELYNQTPSEYAAASLVAADTSSR
ncbi:7TM diverse intracellular signaling domain-containing protein [Hymenobacter busanensis]|nr:7TM diverse intracellular signaling domain-containing protein [Hymenobacter busanensis]QHJ07779.1 response regulator [Hymenobacter busanensis]